jgi:hypothetical protein
MDPAAHAVAITAALGISLLVLVVVRILSSLRGEPDLNLTDDWTPAPGHERETPVATPLTPFDREIIEEFLEADETLVGFARAFFVPARAKDYRFGTALEKLPLLIAATPRRILLFEVTLLTVHRHRFVAHGEIASLEPPQSRLLGTSSKMRLVLKDGRAYQLQFFGPLLNDEGMKLEQSLAEHFRGLAERLEASTRRAAA